MDSKPLIYILHGAWHSPQHFEVARERLEALGYTVICPKQPSTGADPPTVTLYDDAAQVRAELDLLVEDGLEIFIVMHSYGGLVGSEAAAGLGWIDRAKRGLQGGVVGLLYVCAFILPLGHHLCTALGGELAPFIKAEVFKVSSRWFPWLILYRLVQSDGSCNPINPEHVFYNDLSPPEQQFWTSKLKHHTAIAQKTPLTRSAQVEIPVSYLYCENDQALPLWLQKDMVKQSGLKVYELCCTAGHSPFLSQPDVFVDKVNEALTAISSNPPAVFK